MNKIGLCFMNVGEKYKQITYWSRQNKISYCNLHGYDFIEDESVYNPDKPIPWTKIPLILKYIDSYDYIIWVDADILIMNTNIKVEDFIKTYPCNIICGSDWKMINTGVMIIKCNDFTKEFIKSIENNIYDPNEDNSGRYLNWEQGSFINLYDKNFMNCKEHIHITRPTELNSYWFNYFPGHFVLHFAGVRGQLLQYLIRDYYPGRFNYEDDNSFNSRMEWLAGPVRDHLDKKLHHEKQLEIKNMYSFRILLDELKVYHYDISNKIRIGNNYDGGYVIPNNITFSKLYSFGISNNMTFDVDFVDKFNIPALLFDPTISKLPNDVYNYNKLTFNKIGLYSSNCSKMIGNIICDVKTLDTLLENEDNNIILKIDIEGDEFSSILSTSDNILNKCACIVAEFHWLTNNDDLKLHIDCHFIAGLPGESEEHLFETAEWLKHSNLGFFWFIPLMLNYKERNGLWERNSLKEGVTWPDPMYHLNWERDEWSWIRAYNVSAKLNRFVDSQSRMGMWSLGPINTAGFEFDKIVNKSSAEIFDQTGDLYDHEQRLFNDYKELLKTHAGR